MRRSPPPPDSHCATSRAVSPGPRTRSRQEGSPHGHPRSRRHAPSGPAALVECSTAVHSCQGPLPGPGARRRSISAVPAGPQTAHRQESPDRVTARPGRTGPGRASVGLPPALPPPGGQPNPPHPARRRASRSRPGLPMRTASFPAGTGAPGGHRGACWIPLSDFPGIARAVTPSAALGCAGCPDGVTSRARELPAGGPGEPGCP